MWYVICDMWYVCRSAFGLFVIRLYVTCRIQCLCHVSLCDASVWHTSLCHRSYRRYMWFVICDMSCVICDLQWYLNAPWHVDATWQLAIKLDCIIHLWWLQPHEIETWLMHELETRLMHEIHIQTVYLRVYFMHQCEKHTQMTDAWNRDMARRGSWLWL